MSMQYSTKKLAENKLIILHLLQKMGISLSNSEICQFLLEKNYMDYFSIQQYVSLMMSKTRSTPMSGKTASGSVQNMP